MTIQRVGVIGGGLMGSGIAEVCARAGSRVIVHEIHAEAADAARARIETSLDRGVEKGRLDLSDRDSTLARVEFSTDLSDQADRQLIIEAATEDEEIQKRIFADLDAVVAAESIGASNTSSIPITRIAAATSRAGRGESGSTSSIRSR